MVFVLRREQIAHKIHMVLACSATRAHMLCYRLSLVSQGSEPLNFGLEQMPYTACSCMK